VNSAEAGVSGAAGQDDAAVHMLPALETSGI